jgi:murein DD-endopeptidase MepM/ murein hydrolase activator NlpD
VSNYRPPVDAPVLDPFREPAGPYGPGNRGLEYGTTPGGPARAIGDGVVAFAGQVAGRLVLSVVHPDGLRSSLTGLAEVTVGVGTVVAAGDPVGRTGPRLHLGVRRNGRYIDPATLFGGGPPRHAVLVPLTSGVGVAAPGALGFSGRP